MISRSGRCLRTTSAAGTPTSRRAGTGSRCGGASSATRSRSAAASRSSCWSCSVSSAGRCSRRILGHGPNDLFDGGLNAQALPWGPWAHFKNVPYIGATGHFPTVLFPLGSDGPQGRDEFSGCCTAARRRSRSRSSRPRAKPGRRTAAGELIAPLWAVAPEREEDRREVAGRPDVRDFREVRPMGPNGSACAFRPPSSRSFGPCPSQRREHRTADETEQDQEDDRDAAADRDLVALEATPHLLPVAPRLDVGVPTAEVVRRQRADLEIALDNAHRRMRL